MEIIEFIEKWVVWLFTRKLKIGSLFDVPIFIHGSLLLPMEIVSLLGAISIVCGEGVSETLHAVFRYFGTIFVVFGCVTLHEFGHILMARTFGVRAKDVSLFFFGGVASIETTLFKTPLETFLVATGGPAVNAALLAIWMFLPESFQFQPFLDVNKMLLLFNLLPIYPMDGGRVVESICQWFARDRITPHLTALEWTGKVATIATGFCVPIFVYLGNWWAAFLILGLYFAGQANVIVCKKEAIENHLKKVLGELRASAADETLFRGLLIKLALQTHLLRTDPNTATEKANELYEKLYSLHPLIYFGGMFQECYDACKDDLERFILVEKTTGRWLKSLAKQE